MGHLERVRSIGRDEHRRLVAVARYERSVFVSRLLGRRTRVALTIDTELGWHDADALNASRLLDVLAGEQVLASFFLTGTWVSANPDLARRITASGHLVGNHTFDHPPLRSLTEEEIRDTVRRAGELIERTMGVDPRPWFRCPYGDGADDPRVRGALEALGYRHVPWDVSTKDWLEGQEPEAVAKTAIRGAIDVGDGARLLFHSWPDATVGAMPQVIARLRRAGACFVRLDEL